MVAPRRRGRVRHGGVDPLEVAFQNVALAVGLAVAFFPKLTGVAITSILWGVVHLVFGFALAAVWARIPAVDAAKSALSPAG